MWSCLRTGPGLRDVRARRPDPRRRRARLLARPDAAATSTRRPPMPPISITAWPGPSGPTPITLPVLSAYSLYLLASAKSTTTRPARGDGPRVDPEFAMMDLARGADAPRRGGGHGRGRARVRLPRANRDGRGSGPGSGGRSGCRFGGSASGSVSRVSRPVSGSGPPVFVPLAVVWVRVCRG